VLDRADGESLLARRGLRGLRTAVSVTSKESDSGWWQFWRGYILQFEDLSLARSEFLAAETRFSDREDAVGLDLSACALIQSTLLDNQSYDRFDERAERVARLRSSSDAATPLTWFRLAARLLLLAERRNGIDRATDDVERAFGALGAQIDREIALRVATAALPVLGLMLDRVRGEDFFQAGAAVAASPSVGPYSRALWHLFVVEARSYDAS
jgi:hypothetical protein